MSVVICEHLNAVDKLMTEKSSLHNHRGNTTSEIPSEVQGVVELPVLQLSLRGESALGSLQSSELSIGHILFARLNLCLTRLSLSLVVPLPAEATAVPIRVLTGKQG